VALIPAFGAGLTLKTEKESNEQLQKAHPETPRSGLSGAKPFVGAGFARSDMRHFSDAQSLKKALSR
jgi:hypothetical protein